MKRSSLWDDVTTSNVPAPDESVRWCEAKLAGVSPLPRWGNPVLAQGQTGPGRNSGRTHRTQHYSRSTGPNRHPSPNEGSTPVFSSSPRGTSAKLDRILGRKIHLHRFKRIKKKKKIIQYLLSDHSETEPGVKNRKITGGNPQIRGD